MSTAALVEQLYQKFLFRGSDEAGKAYWVNRLDTGQDTLAQVTYNFAQSQEYSQRAKSVSELYFLLFERVPDSEGMKHWLNQIDQGMSTDSLAETFMNSQEYVNKYGEITDDSAFINKLFQNGTGEAPNGPEEDKFTSSLNEGGRVAVIQSLVDYDKFELKHGSEIGTSSLYYGVLGRAPSEQELSSAPDNVLELIDDLYIHPDYSDKTSPEASFINFSEGSSGVWEFAGSLAITLTRTVPLDNEATVNYTITPTGPTQTGDFSELMGSVTFAAGASTAEIQLQVINNDVSMPNRNYEVKLTTVQGGYLHPDISTHNIVVWDKDEPEYPVSAPGTVNSLAENIFQELEIKNLDEPNIEGGSVIGTQNVELMGIQAADQANLIYGNDQLFI